MCQSENPKPDLKFRCLGAKIQRSTSMCCHNYRLSYYRE